MEQGVNFRVYSLGVGVQGVWSLARYTWVDRLGFRGGLVFHAHRYSYHSTLSSRVIRKKKVEGVPGRVAVGRRGPP